MDASLREKVVIDERTPSIPREQYRRIAAVLHEAQHAKGLRVVMVASAVGGEGKTLTAVNLALTLSESYKRRVLLVDGDFRAPTLHRAFPLFSITPIAETSNARGMELVLGDVSPTLAILSSRESTSDPMADLTSERMKEVIADARRTYDWVVVDTPPVVALPDAPLLGSMVDGVVLVIRAGSTAHALVARAIDSLGRSRILGVVLNDARFDVRELDDKRYGSSARVLL
jgi:receptor protein-tyrosine kinase